MEQFEDIKNEVSTSEEDEELSEIEEFADLINENEKSSSEEDDSLYEKSVRSEKRQIKFIFPQSKLTENEFNYIFQLMCQKLKIPLNKRNIFLQFIKTLLPPTTNISSSYYVLNEKLKHKIKKMKKTFKICSKCYSIFKKECTNQDCINEKKRKSIDAIIFNFKKQLKNILKKNWKNILKYKGDYSKI